MNRRDFLKGAAVSAVAASMAGLSGCGSSRGNSNGEAAPQTKGTQQETAGKHSWEIIPDPITDIAEQKDYDIVIVGAGPSGCAAAEAAASNGASVAKEV